MVCLAACGCTSVSEYIHNGFKVGPNYSPPSAAVAKDWIDAADPHLRRSPDELWRWWSVFKDPVLESLICEAYRQNPTLRAAGCRVLEARSQMLIDVGNLFPQTQAMNGDFTRNALSRETANGANIATRWFSQWDYGFNLRWELDFWGQFRRAVESDSANLDASVESYDDALVTLLADVATNYVQYRTTAQRIKYAEDNVKIQSRSVEIVEGMRKPPVELATAGALGQVRSTLEQTQAGIPELQIALRQYANALCTLVGIPPQDLAARLGRREIPKTPAEVVLGIPADLLRRRPDVRRAERQVAAQSAQIGIAEAQLYPHIAINGTIGLSAQQFGDLFRQQALAGSVGPSFTWNILNYGRLRNNVNLQEQKFQELVATYQATVLAANQDVENGLVQFLRARQREAFQHRSADDEKVAVDELEAYYAAGVVDLSNPAVLTQVTLLQQNLVTAEDTLAQAQGEIALGLIQVYRALGGGWQMRCTGCEPGVLPPGAPAAAPESIPAPAPSPGRAAAGAPVPRT
jgi:NodT family efflux transporter outer membrane factor (OMF) lipoprotein